ncbi:GNAT family N-acetyltransferase [Ruegeria meonggei]|uniref:GNAT family N-acetyltransferase n=1 Tax=Ruegeria meonggei TaxID=1446476 RepID=UPI0036710C3B
MKDTSHPNLRRAVQQDARDLAKLIDIAGEGIPSWLWGQNTAEGQSPLTVGIARARRTSGGFSYTNAVVSEEAGQVLGMALTYPIDAAPDTDIADLPDPIKPFVELEALSTGTWFVNALATYPSSRNRGIGTVLLAKVEEQARRAGYSEISIQVYGQNTGALRLYQRLGFEPVAQAPVLHHPCPPYYTGDVILLIRKIAQRSG